MSQGGNPIRYGIFLMPVHDGKKPLEQCIEEDLQLIVRAEELGFSEFWIGEHHSSIFENIIMPEIFIAQALAMTKNIRLGPAPVCLQYHHPAHVAGRLAFLDHLSHGRLNLCFGPGSGNLRSGALRHRAQGEQCDGGGSRGHDSSAMDYRPPPGRFRASSGRSGSVST